MTAPSPSLLFIITHHHTRFQRARFLFFAFMILCSVRTAAQSPLDSLVKSLKDDPHLLHEQLSLLMSHEFLTRINRDAKSWPNLRDSIATMVIKKAKSFSNTSQIVAYAGLAEVLVREGSVINGYSLAKIALKKNSTIRGLQQSYAWSRYAVILRRLNLLDSAIFYAEKTLDLAHEMESDSLEKISLDKLSIYCYMAKSYLRAEFYYKQLIKNPLSDVHNNMDYYNTIGVSYRRRAMYDSSNAYYRRALPLAESLKDTAWIGLLHGNIGYNEYLQKRYTTALPELLKDNRYSFRSRNYNSGLNALCTIIHIYLALDNKNLGKLYYDTLVSRMHLATEPSVRLAFLKVSTDYFEKTGNLQKAVMFSRQVTTFSDSIETVQNIAKAAELEAQFDFNRQVRKIENLEEESKIQLAANRLKNYLLFGTSFFILLGLGFFFELYRSNRFKLKTNQLLQAQNSKISQQAENLNQLNDTKDKLFSIISHDLRSPIKSLKALMSMADKKMITPEEFHRFLGQLQHNVEHVNFTLDNVLYWSTSQLQGMQTRPRPIRLSDLVAENFNLLSPVLADKDITAENHVPENAMAMADQDQIRLVIRNLISNAIKFTGKGGKIDVTHTTHDGMQILTVRDTGIGIEPAALQNLFKGTTGKVTYGTAGEKGTGLGLSLCREMVERNHGTIRVESIPGQGASFIFSLPDASA